MAKEREKPEERMTGLDIIADVSWGAHFCLFYQTKEDLIEILVPYFKAGLENNESCMWVTSEPLGVEDAKESLRRAAKNLDDYIENGQIEIVDYSQWYTKSGMFEADKVLQGWVEKEDQALKRGFGGLRITGNTFWLEKRDWKEFADYEVAVDDVIRQHRMIVICTYSLDKCGASEIIDVVSNHQFALIRREGKWEIVQSAERKRAEEALRRGEQEIRLIAENVPALFSYVDADGRYRFVNRRYEEWFGLPRTEIVGKHYREVLGESTYRLIRDRVDAALAGQRVRYEEALPYARGGTRWVIADYLPDTDDREKVKGFFALITDITERKRAEEETRHRSKQLALINEVGQRIAPILELNELYQTVVEVVQEKFFYQNVAILSVRGDEVALEAIAGPEANVMPPDYTQKMGEGMVGWVAQSGETLLANDVTKEPRFLHLDYLDIAAELDVPIRLGGKTIGVLLVDSDRPNVFTEADVTTLETIAGQVAQAIENARLYGERRRKAEELATLNAIAMTVTSTLDLQEVLQAIQERVMESLGEIYPPLFFLFNEEDQTYKATPTPLQEQGLKRVEKLVGVNFEEISLPLADLNRALREALLAGRPYLTDDLSDLSQLGISKKSMKDAQGELEINSIVGLRLWVKGKLAGFVLLASPKETIPDEEMELLPAIASQAAIAIENARLYDETKRKAQELAALYDVSLDVAAQLDLDTLLKTILLKAMELLRANAGGLYLYHPERQDLELIVHQGLRKDYKGTRLALGEGACGKVAQSGEPLVVTDYSNWEGRSSHFADEPTFNVLAVPIKLGDTLLGALYVDDPDVERKFEEGDIRLATLFANQAAIAIENARLYEQTDENLRRTVAELAALYAIAESLTSSLELDEMLESVVTRVAQVMEARICTIRLVEGDELTIGAAVGYRDEPARQHRIKIDARLARTVRGQKPLLVEDLWESEDIPPSRRDRAKREGVHSFLGVPMISKGKTIGVLSIYGEEPHRFTEGEISLLYTIANQAAIAIDNASLYERVREHAEELERLVQERTKELQAIHAELLQSAKLAALGQLAAGVAHELNNPLGAISGYLELLQEGVELGPQEMDYMERIEKRIQQATRIVGELRSVGIPSQPVWQIVNVNDILEEILTLLERRLSLHQIKVQK